MTAPTVDVGILTIRDDEFRAILKAFPGTPRVYKGRHREYALRTTDAGNGTTYSVAILRQVEQGNGEAQEAARDLIDDLQPSLLLVVGIAGGLPSDDITLGDVVLSTRIVDFSVEARRFEESTTYSMGGGPIARSIAAGVANLSARDAELGEWWADLPAKPKVLLATKNFYGPSAWKRLVKEKLQAHFGKDSIARPPTFSAGPIASSDRLIKDPEVLTPWISTARNIQAIEMEAAGVHRAARDRTPMLAIRGLSDIVGFKRQDQWTKYACAAAADFARAYLRTTPVPLNAARTASAKAHTAEHPLEDLEATENQEEAFANLLPLRHFPEHLYVGPALCRSLKHGWQVLLKGTRGPSNQRISGAWTLFEGNIYSFIDPETSPLRSIVDIGGIEPFSTSEWAFSDDENKRRVFLYLLNTSLREDLWSHGVRYFADDDIFAFVGQSDEPPRKLKYANLKVRSTVTVVAHYQTTSKAGKQYTYLRHSAFQGRFRYRGRQWYLEITPTYRFTRNGRDLDRFHESRLSGIKRLERNRSVLSQLLVWQAVLRAPWVRSDRVRLLQFDPLLSFKFSSNVKEEQLTEIDPPAAVVSNDKEIIG